MGCLKTDSCCCCFSLRTGGLILGWLSIIGGIGGVISYIIKSPEYMKQLAQMHSTPEQALISSVITLLVAGLFLYGIYYKRPSFMLPDVILTIIGFIIVVIIVVALIVISIIGLATEDGKAFGGVMLIALIVLLPAIVLFWHFTAVTLSLYQRIKEENDNHPGVVYHAPQRDPYKV